MRYQKFQPVTELQPFVECYFVWEGDAGKELDVQSPPNSFCSIVFNYGNPYKSYQANSPTVAVASAFASGQFTSNYHLVLQGKIGITGIVFKPTSLNNFFGWRMSELVNTRTSLSVLLGSLADELLNEIKNQNSDGGRIKILEDFARSHLQVAKANLSVIDDAVEYMDDHKGSLSVEPVSEHFKISRRYLEKKFLDKVGISPKLYSRIRRFMHLSRQVAYNPQLDWQDMIFQSGLHDQSHLVKEFLEFDKMSPSDYLEKHQELIRFTKAK